MEVAEGLAVDVVLGDSQLLRCHRHILLVPFHLDLRTDERHDGGSILFGADDIEFVVHIEECLLVRHYDMSIVEHA